MLDRRADHKRTTRRLQANEKTRADQRRRSDEWRGRIREAKKAKRWFDGEPDKEVSRYVKLKRSEIARVVSEMHLEPGADQWLSARN